MMKSTDARERDNVAPLGRLSESGLRWILVQRQVSTTAVVVTDILSKEPSQVPFIQDDDVVQAVPS